MRRLSAPLLALALLSPLAAPQPAAAQGEDFYVQQVNFALRDLNKELSTIRDLREEMSTERDFTRGCSLLGSVIYHLEESQRLLKRMLEYTDTLGDVDSYNSMVTDYNNVVEDLNGSRDDYERLCSG